ncbi:MAG TPA: hypothetical protein VMF53_02560 [Alphaproteobacteria bacterium]|nr:hypothetical protein [Alphaproteobacteria bacterium]
MRPGSLIARLERRALHPAAAAAVAMLALAALGACQITGELPCPAAKILRDASQVTRFTPGAAENAANLRYVASIDDAKLNCTYDSSTYDKIDVALAVKFDATRPPGRPADTVELRYFVAIVNLQGEILAKKDFPLQLAFGAGATATSLVDSLRQTIPIKYPQNGGSLEIWVGYQLSPADLAYNRAHPVE